MRDKRPVDELSIEELERILAIKKRERRQQQLRRMSKDGRRSVVAPVEPPAPIPQDQSIETVPQPAAAPASVAETAIVENNNPVDNSMPAAMFVDDEGPPASVDAPVDGNGTATAENGNGQGPSAGRMIWNRSLLLVEVAAVIGILFIGWQLVGALQTLQRESAAVQAEAQAAALAGIATATPIPDISINQVVLPGGHTPPRADGTGGEFNINEIPEHLRPIILQQLSVPIVIPTPQPESPIWVEIPSIGVRAPVVSGTSPEALKRGVGHQQGTGQPGSNGNMVLSAHNDIYGEIFRYIDQLQPGDEIIVNSMTQQYTYIVRDSEIVSPWTTRVLDATRNPTTTLISCYPYNVDNQRYIVYADLVQN